MRIFPRYTDATLPDRDGQIEEYFSDTSRGCLIVGNGPSASRLDYSKIPVNPYVFRCNWFFLETAFYFGKRVDAYFWSVYNEGLHSGLASAANADYAIEHYFQPFLLPDNSEIKDPVASKLSPSYDHWAFLAQEPLFARAFMSRPLPTQGVQMIATAIMLGFTEIHIAGIDFYADPNTRYHYPVPDSVKQYLQPKDFSGGYENNHSLSVDIRFLELTKARFPNVKLYAHGLHERYPALFDAPPDLGNSSRPNIVTKGNSSRGISAVRRNKNSNVDEHVAYATFATPEFSFGLMALANSIARTTDIPLVVMVLPGDEHLCDGIPNAHAVSIRPISNPNQLETHQKRFSATYSKLNTFGLEFLDKVVYIDADAIVVQPVDDLFDIDEFAAAPDIGFSPSSSEFNSGVFVCRPDVAIFDQMVRKVNSVRSKDGGDQGFLNEFFPTPHILDRSYNCLKRVATELPILFNETDVKILHFVGVKPWEQYNELDTKFRQLDLMWFGCLTTEQQARLFLQLRSREYNADSILRRRYGIRFDEAIRDIEESMRVDQIVGDRRHLDVADDLYFRGDFDSSSLISRVALRRSPLASEHMYRLARSLLKLGDLADAKALIEQAIKLKPKNDRYQKLLAEIDGMPVVRPSVLPVNGM